MALLRYVRQSILQIFESSSLSYIGGGLGKRRKIAPRYTIGTGRLQRDRGFQRRYTIAGSGTQDIDLAGTLQGLDGTTTTFGKICEIEILNLSTANTIKWGPKATSTFGVGTLFEAAGDRLFVGVATGDDEPGVGSVSHPAGISVVAGSDTLTIVNNGSTETIVEVTLVGKSA